MGLFASFHPMLRFRLSLAYQADFLGRLSQGARLYLQCRLMCLVLPHLRLSCPFGKRA